MEDIALSGFGDILKAYRKRRKISQQELASRLDLHRNTIGGWERGDFLPESKTMVLELAKQLHLNENETRQLLQASLTAISPYWNVPYQRNPFFTGRAEVLHRLHDALTQKGTAVISQSYSLSGLGGIGKTQTAIEYAYRYTNDYAAVFWISAETNESIVSSFVSIAELLNLPEKQDKEQSRVMAAVTRWLTSHSDWLLIFDNVEDLDLVKSVLPPARSGSLLFTSRRQALGLSAHTLSLEQMSSEVGMRFLLHRARLLEPATSLDSLASSDATLAREIVAAMDGLPLALDQAGAYIEATQCSLSDYLHLFQSAQLRLLDERDTHADHPASVTRTFALAFEQLERNNPTAAELLTVCAFLAPEAIPETFFIEGAAHLGPTFETLAADPFAFQMTIKILLAYSLLQRNAVIRTVTIHRLVQAVLKERLAEAKQRTWVTSVVRVMTNLFPSEDTSDDYRQACERLLPHASVCIMLGEQWGEDEAQRTTLMSHVAIYLSKHARYIEAESLFKRALQMGEKALGTLHPLKAEILHEMANLYREQGKNAEAEPLFKHAIQIREQTLGAEHVLTATSLERLGYCYYQQSKYIEAEPLYLRALSIREQVLGSEHPQIALSLTTLSILYHDQGKYEQAEPLLLRALHIREQTAGFDHPQVAVPLINLAQVYNHQGKYTKVEPLYLRALSLFEQALGPKHYRVGTTLNNLGAFYSQQGKYEQAELLLQRALAICEQALGPEHPQVAEHLNAMGLHYARQGKYEQAEPLLQRALSIQKQVLGPDHPEVAETLSRMAELFHTQSNIQKAFSLAEHALRISQQTLGGTHPQTIKRRALYEQLLIEQAAYDLSHGQKDK